MVNVKEAYQKMQWSGIIRYNMCYLLFKTEVRALSVKVIKKEVPMQAKTMPTKRALHTASCTPSWLP